MKIIVLKLVAVYSPDTEYERPLPVVVEFNTKINQPKKQQIELIDIEENDAEPGENNTEVSSKEQSINMSIIIEENQGNEKPMIPEDLLKNWNDDVLSKFLENSTCEDTVLGSSYENAYLGLEILNLVFISETTFYLFVWMFLKISKNLKT